MTLHCLLFNQCHGTVCLFSFLCTEVSDKPSVCSYPVGLSMVPGTLLPSHLAKEYLSLAFGDSTCLQHPKNQPHLVDLTSETSFKHRFSWERNIIEEQGFKAKSWPASPPRGSPSSAYPFLVLSAFCLHMHILFLSTIQLESFFHVSRITKQCVTP